MPQFDFAHVFWPQLAWLALFFAVLYFGVVRLTLPKLGRVIGEREDRISGDLVAAKAAKAAADEVIELYQSELNASRDAARASIAAAKVGAAKASEVRLSAATAAAERQISEAEGRIASAVAAAEDALRNVAAESAQAIVARLTGGKLAIAAARAQVDARMSA